MKTYAIGDIHGAYFALLQCLKSAQFSYENDRLIILGDVCDRNSNTKECIDELCKIENCDFILGNHDKWALNWALYGEKPEIWLHQGGLETIASYDKGIMLQTHIDFLKKSKLWIERDEQLFVHGGFDPGKPLDEHDENEFIWNRNFIQTAWRLERQGNPVYFGKYKDIFVGHTPTLMFDSQEPLHCCNVWDLDTGIAYSGKLTIMDVDTKQYWQSDKVR